VSSVKRQVFPRRPFRLPSRGESYKTPPTPLKRGELFLEICLLATPSLWREGWEGSSGGKAGMGLSTPPLTRGGWVGSFALRNHMQLVTPSEVATAVRTDITS